MKKPDYTDILIQSDFCKILMNHLCQDVAKQVCTTPDYAYDVNNHTQLQKDIIRLRRELMILSKMFIS